jgi:hypothetical protein
VVDYIEKITKVKSMVEIHPLPEGRGILSTTSDNLKNLIKAIKAGMFNDLTVEEAEGTYTVIFYGTIVEGVTDRMTYISDEFSSRKEAFDYIETKNEPYKNHPDYAQAYKGLMEPEFIIEIEGGETIHTKKAKVKENVNYETEIEEYETYQIIEYRDGFFMKDEDGTYSVMMYVEEDVYSFGEKSPADARATIDKLMITGV